MPRSLFLGSASLLALALIGVSYAAPAAPTAPRAPSAPAAAPAPRAQAVPQSAPTAPAPPVAPNAPVARYDVKGVEISDVYGSVRVMVSDRGPVTLVMGGSKPLLDNIHVTSTGGLLSISEEHANRVWDWHEWFNFKPNQRREKVTLQITAPKGTSLDVDDFVGDINVGDLEGPVKIGAAAATGTIGNVSRADIELAGSGKLAIGTVAQQLRIEIAGAGTVDAGASGGASVEIAGSGDSHLGPVLGSLRVEIAGSGDVTAASVNGPTDIETAGSGSIKIDTGEANPLKVEILGAGDFTFGGEAVDPSISVMGSGNVTIKSYRGRLNTDGMAHVKIGG